MKKIIAIFTFLFVISNCYSTTWDEPWQKEIIQSADYFVYGEVVESSDTLIIVEIEKAFSSQLSGKVTIDNFYLLKLCSLSGGHGLEFNANKGLKAYFFLTKGENGNFQLPTPTSGVHPIVEGQVYATYRHSYHQAAVSMELYEKTYIPIWNKYHKLDFNSKPIQDLIDLQLTLDPAGFEENEIETFFKQHVALESAYLLELEIDFSILKKFADSDNFHSQVSAIQAMRYAKGDAVKVYLFSYIQKDSIDRFCKVIAIQSLWYLNDSEYRQQLSNIKDKLSDEETGFGGNIMDPRVCTHFPSPKSAVEKLESDPQ